MLDPAQHLFDLPGTNITVNELQGRLVSQSAIGPSQPVSGPFFAS